MVGLARTFEHCATRGLLTDPVCSEKLIRIGTRDEMIALMCFCLRLFTLPFKSKIRLEAENAILRHHLTVLQRKIRGAFASPIAIGYSSFGSIVGFRQCWMRFGSSDRRPWCAGTARAFVVTDVGSPDR